MIASSLVGTIVSTSQIKANTIFEENFYTVGDRNEFSNGCGTTSLGILGTIINNTPLKSRGEEDAALCVAQSQSQGEPVPEDLGLQLIYPERYPGNSNQLRDIIAGATHNLIYNRPYSGLQYIEQKVLAVVNSGRAFAQTDSEVLGDLEAPAEELYYPGTGFSLLQPIQGIWGWIVNIVYGFMILVIIIVAFGVMFRVQLPDGAAITIQSAIPNIALAMILIPLSYAVSGFFIDLITISTNAIHQFMFGTASPTAVAYYTRNCSVAEINEYLALSPDQKIGDFSDVRVALARAEGIDLADANAVNAAHCNYQTTVTSNLGSAFTASGDRGLFPDDDRLNWVNATGQADISDEFDNFLGNAYGGTISDINNNSFMLGVINLFLNGDANNGWIAELINLILNVILLITGILIFLHLFGKYLVLLLLPTFSPIVFLTIAIPGQGTKTIIWYAKMMGAAAFSFIATYFAFLLITVFSNAAFQAQLPDTGAGLYVPPLLGIETIIEGTVGSGSDASAYGFVLSLVGIAIYLNIPKFLNDFNESNGTTTKQLFSLFLDAWENAKSNYSFARNAVGGTVGAVKTAGGGIASVAKGSFAAGRTALNTRKNFRALRENVRGAAGNISDRVRGITPGSTDSSAYRRTQNIQGNLADAERIRRNAIASGDTRTAAQQARLINKYNQQLETIKKTPGGGKALEEMKDGTIKAQFQTNDGKPVINFTPQEILSFARMATSDGNGVSHTQLVGKIALEADGGFLFPSDAGNQVFITGITTYNPSAQRSDTQKTGSGRSVNSISGSVQNSIIFNGGALGGVIDIILDTGAEKSGSTSQFASGDGKTFGMSFSLKFSGANPQEILATFGLRYTRPNLNDPSGNLVANITPSTQITLGKQAATNGIRFIVNTGVGGSKGRVESNDVKVFLGLVNNGN